MSQLLKPGAKVHCLGIGGYGINPIARVMHQLGYSISGCDIAESALIPPLRELGIPIEIGHDPAHLDRFGPDVLVISSAIPPDNREVWVAAERDIPVYKRADILCALMSDRIGVAVAGTHGKTTTTAMLASALVGCQADPTFIVGGVVTDLGVNARAGEGPHFVIEADEYDRMFMGLCPKVAVVTTIELDHPDMFKSVAEVRALFEEFIELLPEDGLLVAGADDAEVRQIAEHWRVMRERPTVTYGLLAADWTASDLRANSRGGVDFAALKQGELVAEVSLRLPGTHNVQNALAALAVIDHLKLPVDKAVESLKTFSGVGRRFEVKGEAQGVTVIDDYAHHPTAIRATLAAARMRYPDQSIWAIWQPHTYSRTKALLDEFAASFVGADHVIVTDVFKSRDTDTFGIGPQDVLARMRYHRDAQHMGSFEEIVDMLVLNLTPGDVVIVMSAGDASRICDDLLKALGG